MRKVRDILILNLSLVKKFFLVLILVLVVTRGKLQLLNLLGLQCRISPLGAGSRCEYEHGE